MLLTTQYLDEADHLAALVVIIDGGRVIAEGTPDELKSRVGADIVELHTADVPTMQRAAEVLAPLGAAEPATDPSTRRASIAAPGGAKLLPSLSVRWTRPKSWWRTSRSAARLLTRCSWR